MMKKTSNTATNERGVAIMLAMFSVMLISMVVSELTYEATVEYTISTHTIDDIQAYYAAKSATELSLLRVLVYRKAVSALGDTLGTNASMLDPIWSFPFAWPPVMPEEMMIIDKNQIDEAIKNSKMKATYASTISIEGSRIDLTDLASPIEALRNSTKKQLINIFESQKIDQPDWFKEAGNFNPEELVNNIVDYQDENDESLNGGDEKRSYSDDTSNTMPPNRPLRTVAELHMVAGVTDYIYDLLAPRITVYGNKAINVNYASKELLKSLHPNMTDEIAGEMVKRREDPALGGPFKDVEDLNKFLAAFRIAINAESEEKNHIPLLFGSEYNFRIESSGQIGKSVKKIEAMTYDVDAVKSRVATYVKKTGNYTHKITDDCKDKSAEQDAITCVCTKTSLDNEQKALCEKEVKEQVAQNKKAADKSKAPKPPSGRPNVIFWKES